MILLFLIFTLFFAVRVISGSVTIYDVIGYLFGLGVIALVRWVKRGE